jgi:hypothetical protein
MSDEWAALYTDPQSAATPAAGLRAVDALVCDANVRVIGNV